MTYQHPDKIDVYAAALQSDIGAERFQQVVDSKLETFWIGTVYGGGVATKRGYKFKTPEEAWNNASDFGDALDSASIRVHRKRDGRLIINARGKSRFMTLRERIAYWLLKQSTEIQP